MSGLLRALLRENGTPAPAPLPQTALGMHGAHCALQTIAADYHRDVSSLDPARWR